MASHSTASIKYNVVGAQNKSWPQVLTISIASICSLMYGLVQGWTSPYILKISKDKTNYDISEKEAAYLSIVGPIFMMISSVFSAKLNDIIGRKTTLMLNAIPYIVSFLLIIVAADIKLFYAARMFSGVGDSFFYASMPIYIGEISTPRVRGTWGNLPMITVYLGVFLMNIIGSYMSVEEASYLCLPLPLIFLMLMLALPESPYYYIMNNQEKLAKKSLSFFRGREDVEEEYGKLKCDVRRQMSEEGTWMDLFQFPTNRRALLAAVFLRISQQMSGAMVFGVFTQLIFHKAGTTVSAEVSSMIYTGLMFVVTVCCVHNVEKFGRRNNYKISLFSSGIVLFLLAVYFFLDQTLKIHMRRLQWCPLAGMIVYIIVSSAGIGIIPTLMLSELFSTSIKTKALTFLTVTTGLIQFVIYDIFYVLDENFGLFAPFLLFSISCFISTALCSKLIPETKGKTLEEIQKSLLREHNTPSREVQNAA